MWKKGFLDMENKWLSASYLTRAHNVSLVGIVEVNKF